MSFQVAYIANEKLAVSVDNFPDEGNVAFDKFETLTVTDVVRSLTGVAIAGKTQGIITIEGGDIRFRMDGGTPSITSGHIAKVGDTITISNYANLFNFKAIRVSVDATIQCSYGSV